MRLKRRQTNRFNCMLLFRRLKMTVQEQHFLSKERNCFGFYTKRYIRQCVMLTERYMALFTGVIVSEN